MNVALKYCGSCNPRIDLPRVATQVRERLAGQAGIVSLRDGLADVVVILNGCPTACADREDVRARAARALVVAGESVDTVWVAESELAGHVVAQLLSR